MELQAQSTPDRNFSIINPLNFMRAEYNGAMGIPNNCQLFCEAHENGIPLGFSLPILSQILIVSVYKGTLPLYMITYSLNFMRAKYNGAMGVPNNCQSFCEAPKIRIPAGFPLPFSPKY